MKCFTFSCERNLFRKLPSLGKTISEDNYSIVLVSALAGHILDDLETLVAQLEGHLVKLVSILEFYDQQK